MSDIERDFRAKGVMRGGLLLLRPADARDMVLRARDEGVKVLGLDAFLLRPDETEPALEHSIDFTAGARGEKDSWKAAEDFLVARMLSDLYFEVILE